MWITPEDIQDVYGDINISEGFISHVQSLAEVCVGEQEDPSPQLLATFVDVVYRKHLAATKNPDGVSQEQLGPYMYTIQGAPGLGLTDADCKRLKRAAGISDLWVQPLSRGAVETASPKPGFDVEDIV